MLPWRHKQLRLGKTLLFIELIRGDASYQTLTQLYFSLFVSCDSLKIKSPSVFLKHVVVSLTIVAVPRYHANRAGTVLLAAKLSVSARGSKMNIGGIVFPLEQQTRDEASVVYHAQYDTEGVPHTKSGDRQPVQVSIEVGQHTLTSHHI